MPGSAGKDEDGKHAHQAQRQRQQHHADVVRSFTIDLPTLSNELPGLREQMLAEASEGAHYAAAGAVADAEKAAREGDGPKVLELLAKVGQRGLDIATKIGSEVAVAAIKAGTGL